jgi:translation initiation factor 4G
LVSFAASVSKDKPSLDLSKGKSTIKGGKKKRKEILQKADAAGTTSDLYNAYKGPEEKKETVVSTDSPESTSNSADVKQAQVIGRLDNHDKDEEVITAKKYSRDFLLKFAEQYNDLPKDFQITSDTETLMSANFNISHQASFAASVSNLDKPSLDLSKGKSTQEPTR